MNLLAGMATAHLVRHEGGGASARAKPASDRHHALSRRGGEKSLSRSRNRPRLSKLSIPEMQQPLGHHARPKHLRRIFLRGTGRN